MFLRWLNLLLLLVTSATSSLIEQNSTTPSSSSSLHSPSSSLHSPSPSSSLTPPTFAPSPMTPMITAPWLYTVLSISSGMSLAGALFIIFSWILFTDMHFFSRKIIVYIATTDLFSSAAFLYAGIRKTGVLSNDGSSATLECTIQGFTLQFFVLASYLWTACFAFHLHQLITKKRKKAHHLEVYYHAVSWGIPILITIVLLVEKLTMHTDIIGGADRPWCWLTNHATSSESYDMEQLQQFLMFYLPAVLIFSYNVSIYVFLARQVHGTELGANIRKRVLLYLLVFSVCAVWGLVHRIYQLFSVGHQPLLILTYLESFFGPLQGFLNALVYGVSARVVVRYKRLCGCRVSSMEDAEGVRRSSILSGRSRQGSAPLDGPRYHGSGRGRGSRGSRGGGRGGGGRSGYAAAMYQPLVSDGGAAEQEEATIGRSGYNTVKKERVDLLRDSTTSPMNMPSIQPAGVVGDVSPYNNETVVVESPRSYSDQSVFHRSSHGLLLGKERSGRGDV